MKKLYIVINRGMLEEVCADEEVEIVVIDQDIDGADDETIEEMNSLMEQLRMDMSNKKVFAIL